MSIFSTVNYVIDINQYRGILNRTSQYYLEIISCLKTDLLIKLSHFLLKNFEIVIILSQHVSIGSECRESTA